MTRGTLGAIVAGLALAAPLPAFAQSLGLELATDEVRRGLSWSGGQAAASADLFGTVAGVDATARVVTLRSASRHDGADAAVDLDIARGWRLGGVDVRVRGAAHLFIGARGTMEYGEVGLSAGYGLGPAQLRASVDYAPAQSAIGGDNVYLRAEADAGIPGTPLTLIAGIGHSSGSVDDPARAERLRPGGSYADWRIGLEHIRGPLTLALDYTGTDIGDSGVPSGFADIRHADDRLVARVRVSL